MTFIKKVSNRTYLITFMLAIIIFFIVFINIIFEPMFFPKNPRELIAPYNFNGKVDIIMQDGSTYHTKVPFNIKTDQAFDVVLHLEDIGMIDDKTLSFISKDVLIRCEVDEKVIYRSAGVHSDSRFDDANVMYLIDLPETVENNVIILHYYNDKNYQTTFELKNVKIGKRINTISDYFLRDNLFNFIIMVLLFIICVSIVLSGNLLKKHVNKLESYFNYIALLCLVLGIYIISMSSLSYFVLNKYKILLHLFIYTSMMFIPMILLKTVSFRTSKQTQSLFKIGIFITSCNVIIQFALAIFKISNFTILSDYSHFVMLCSILIIFYSLYKSDSDENNKLKLMTISLLPLLIAIFIECILDLYYGRLLFTLCFKIGVIIFSILQIHEFFSLYISYRDKKIESDVYKKLALIDNLTGYGNRMAFAENKKIYIEQASSFYIIVLDVDNLKFVNDNFGHKFGDDIIKLLPNIINELLGKEHQVDIYRAGGDEFFVVYHTLENNEIEELLCQIRMEYESHNAEDSEKKYSVSYGYSYCDFQKGDVFDEVLHAADQNMYKNKSTKKRRRSDV